MKTPRFFIVLAACAVVFTIASTSIESAFRPCRAETLPVLRLDPRAGDPQEPGFSKRMPFEDAYAELRTSVGYETTSLGSISTPTAPSPSSPPWWTRIRSARILNMLLSARRGLLW